MSDTLKKQFCYYFQFLFIPVNDWDTNSSNKSKVNFLINETVNTSGFIIGSSFIGGSISRKSFNLNLINKIKSLKSYKFISTNNPKFLWN